MSLPSLILGTVVLPRRSAREIQQRDGYDKSIAQHRTGPDGDLFKQTLYRKRNFTISGQGFVPLALAGFDWESSFTLYGIKPTMVADSDNVVNLPTARRTDIPYLAFALVSGVQIETGVNVVGDVATCVAVAGATRYYVQYFPTYNVKGEPPEDTFDEEEGEFVWSLDLKEV
jgi:hypothetical protein